MSGDYGNPVESSISEMPKINSLSQSEGVDDTHNTSGKDEVTPIVEIHFVDKDPTVFKTPDLNSYDENISSKIGTHIGRAGEMSISETISLYTEMFLMRSQMLSTDALPTAPPPIQMLLRSPEICYAGISDYESPKIRQLIDNFNIHYYTHSAFIINLSNPVTKRNPTSDVWIMGLLTKDLIETDKIGGRGVVVHVGKHCDMDPIVALNNMEYYTRKALDYATEECPLLLETAAGQGTELCVKIEDLSSFYDRFSQDEKKKFKICVDTCHVFAAGYDPLKFLKGWEQLHPGSIRLVHFNDSKCQIGAKKDRHSPYLEGGYIGFRKLMKVAQWCLERSIDMVTE